jgi:hypothetical protein
MFIQRRWHTANDLQDHLPSGLSVSSIRIRSISSLTSVRAPSLVLPACVRLVIFAFLQSAQFRMCLRMPVSLHVGPGRLLTDDLLSGEATRMEVLTGVVHGRYDLLRQCLGHNDCADQYLGRAKLLSVEECTLMQAHAIRTLQAILRTALSR